METKIQKITGSRLITQVQIQFAENLNLILKDVEEIKKQENPIVREIMFANAKAAIEDLLTDDLMINVYKLFGDPSGVRTDGKPFDKKKIFIQACILGLSMRGQQFNVLGGNLYIRAQGYLPKLRKYPGLTFVYPFRHRIPVRDATTLTTTVTTDMEYTLNGTIHKESITYPVARQEGQGNDAILGKATTKMCCWLWNTITGEDTVDDSGVFIEPETTENGTKGTGERVVNASVSNKKEDRKENGEFITEMISNEYQTLFNTYISKASSKEDLIKRVKTWCDTPNAIKAGVTYTLVEDKFESPNIDLTVFTEVMKKFS